MSITQERLKEVLHYDPETGDFTWKTRKGLRPHDIVWNKRFAGKRAGSVNKPSGYVYICVDKTVCTAHRLAWLYMHGEFPRLFIDHADMNRANNIASNLRLATQSQNMANTLVRKDNSTGFKGVVLHRNRLHQKRPWQARMKKKSLGYYETSEEASRAYAAALKSKFGEFARSA